MLSDHTNVFLDQHQSVLGRTHKVLLEHQHVFMRQQVSGTNTGVFFAQRVLLGRHTCAREPRARRPTPTYPWTNTMCSWTNMNVFLETHKCVQGPTPMLSWTDTVRLEQHQSVLGATPACSWSNTNVLLLDQHPVSWTRAHVLEATLMCARSHQGGLGTAPMCSCTSTNVLLGHYPTCPATT